MNFIITLATWGFVIFFAFIGFSILLEIIALIGGLIIAICSGIYSWISDMRGK